MSLSDEERRIIVGVEYEKACKTIDKALEYQTLGHWDTVANRLYYSLFHAVNALLINDGHSVNTHRGVISVFGNDYIRTGIFPKEAGRLYSDLQTLRNNSDYNCSFDATEEEIKPLIEPTRQLIEDIGKYLQHTEA